MNYSPASEKKTAAFVSCVLLAVSVAAFLFSNVGGISPLPLQLISLVCAVAGVYVAVRFIFTSFTYSIRSRDGSVSVSALPAEALDFYVSKTQGKRGPVTECRLSMADLTQVTEYSGELTVKLREKHGNVSVYIYTESLIPEKRYALVFDDGGECICLVIEADERFSAALSSYIPRTDAEI